MAQTSIPEFPVVVKKLQIAGIPFEAAEITNRCYTLTSLRSGKVVQFATRSAREEFIVGLEWYLCHKQAMAQAA